jgi:hypothetical protein
MAMIVIMGFTPLDVGNALASTTNNPRTSCDSPVSPTTECAGGLPMAQLAIWWKVM